MGSAVTASGDPEMVATCPLDVWDGPYKMTCGRVLGRDGECLTHWAYRGCPPPTMVVRWFR